MTVKTMPARLAVDAIVIGQRHRRDLGDVSALARSIEAVGLLHPIVVTRERVLIAGERRLAACRSLGWTDVPVTAVDISEIVRGEFAENADRKDFLPSEIEAIRRAMMPAEKEAAKVRMSDGGKGGKVSQPTQGPERARDKVAGFAGVSGRTVEKIAAVVEAAERDPEKFAPLVTDMDRTGKVDGAFKKMKAIQNSEALRERGIALPAGKYSVIYADPPWSFQAWSGEGTDRAAENHYPTMTQAEIEALPIGDLAADNCALFMWAVMPQLPEALRVIEAWGFTYKTCAFVWVKQTKDGERFATGMGYWTRANAEVCLLATRGSPQRLNADVHQVIASPRMEHSRKPEEVATRIERLVAGPYIELFRRGESRPGWEAWGNQAEAHPLDIPPYLQRAV